MRYLDQLVKMTQKAVDDVCRSAAAIPSDREDWSPGGDARSALSQMRELSTQASWFLPVFRDRVVPEFDEHAMKEAKKLQDSIDSLSKCIEATRSAAGELCQAIAAFPEDALEEEIVLPFGGGMTLTMADVLILPYWNMVYHLGQINQLQLLLGDRVMH